MIRPVGQLDEYKYTISDITIAKKGSKDSYNLRSNYIKSISILHKYDTNIAPIIQMTASIEKDLYIELTTSETELTMQFSLHKYIENSDVKAKQLVFSKTFSVLNEYDFQPDEMKIFSSKEDRDEDIVTSEQAPQLMDASFYLIDRKKLEDYRKVKSYSLKGASLTAAIAAMFKDRGFKSLLMSKIPSEYSGDIFIPAYNLLSSLKYVNNVYGVFNTDYIFYMDVDENYLIDKINLGKAVREKSPSTVTLYLEEYGSPESMQTGSTIENDAFIVNMTKPPYVHKLDGYSELMAGSNIVGVDASNYQPVKVDGPEGSLDKAGFALNRKIFSQMHHKASEIRKRLIVNLQDVDIALIAPNLLFSVNAHNSINSKNPIKGKYRLEQSQVQLTKSGDNMLFLQCSLTLVKID